MPLILGMISGFLAPMKRVKSIRAKPPSYVFGIVWTILFLLYGAAWNFTIESNIDNETEYILSNVFYAINMVILFSWPFVYNYVGKWYAMFLLLFSMVFTFSSIIVSPPLAGICLSPLIVWEIFALILNFTIVN